jgi:DnaK suppressor protein
MENSTPSQRGKSPKASSEEVLGTPFGTPQQIDSRWEKQYGALSSIRDALRSRQKDLLDQAAEEVMPPQKNMAELGTDHYDRDWALSMASSEQELLYEIDEAMNRIRKGIYGTCELTGKPIEPGRLEAVPWTRFSAEAERGLEAEGQVRHTRLGALERGAEGGSSGS